MIVLFQAKSRMSAIAQSRKFAHITGDSSELSNDPLLKYRQANRKPVKVREGS